jgi:hypothetical protein
MDALVAEISATKSQFGRTGEQKAALAEYLNALTNRVPGLKFTPEQLKALTNALYLERPTP